MNDGFTIIKILLENSRLALQSQIMKKSKLDQYRDLIVEKLKSNVPSSQIRIDLKNVGCTNGRSTMNEWIEETAAAEGIELPPGKRGRPAKTKTALFSFLPQLGESASGSVTTPLFLYALQEMPPQTARSLRDLALMKLGLPASSNPTATEADDVERLKNLSDTDLCLLALLRSDLPAPPFAKGHEELSRWFTDLVRIVCKLRTEIREASKTNAT